ncbi:hypothetical protein [Leptospira borgpetersenii]|uniref:hypothetical protein n=1 Tax=Leptospira borgpetersenii TaxID=174 RepID=UPI00138F82E5|nr:hypothetical protein [Leptospira borgpetersenii]
MKKKASLFSCDCLEFQNTQGFRVQAEEETKGGIYLEISAEVMHNLRIDFTAQ